ncbi:hypothetical protein TcasGA2_TC000775 [Tribolium castaneum]|uniref:Uncharacterized protein n=1 Tax=Tribolium castaneum TaxID=7070 RepID=D6WD38_TRICA|nr:hypothetical protein TcasGA2_TC000775 [Tribolium castaneum]
MVDLLLCYLRQTPKSSLKYLSVIGLVLFRIDRQHYRQNNGSSFTTLNICTTDSNGRKRHKLRINPTQALCNSDDNVNDVIQIE